MTSTPAIDLTDQPAGSSAEIPSGPNDEKRFDPKQSRTLTGFAALMTYKRETAFEEFASRCLRADKIEYLKKSSTFGF